MSFDEEALRERDLVSTISRGSYLCLSPRSKPALQQVQRCLNLAKLLRGPAPRLRVKGAHLNLARQIGAQSHTPRNCCVRFATTVARGHATLATKRALPLTWTGLPPAGSHQLAWRTHSITSSARASRLSGTVRPSAFTVVRLMTRSNLVGSRNGKSAGLAPRRMRPT